MTRKLIAITVVFIATIFAGCSNKPVEDANISLQQQWYNNSGFAGEVWAQEYLARPKNVNFEVIAGGEGINTTQVVVSNQADFGVAGADQIILANENGADLVVVGVINYRSLAAFISKLENQVFTPQDFKGKRVGLMEGTPVDFVYRVMMSENNIDIGDLKEVPTDWTPNGLILDKYDIYPAFVNDEPISLSKKHPDMRLSIVKPHDFGVDFIGTVYFCKRSLIESDPQKVQAFVNLMIDGWKRANAEPQKAIDVLVRYGGIEDPEKELESLIAGMDYYRGEGGKMLFASEERWESMAQQLKKAGLISEFDFSKTVDNSFVNWYHLNDSKN